MFYARQNGGGTLTVFMCYVVNIWCVRESPDLSSGNMFVSDKKWNVSTKQYSCTVHRHLSVEALCFLIKLGGY